LRLATTPTLPHLGPALASIRGFGVHDISSAVVIDVDAHPILCAVSDEGRVVAFAPLEPDAPFPATGLDLGTVLDGLGDNEIDLEGVTVDGDCVVAVGSLSQKRKRVKPGHDTDEALERLARITKASGGERDHSDHAYRLRPRLVDGALEVELVEAIEVRSRVAALELLAPFASIPSKDNGLDAEGLALFDGSQWLGLRGPVLRGQALLVRMTPSFRKPRLVPLPLDGWGIRALACAADGLWLVSGPTMTHPGPFTLWHVDPRTTPRPDLARIGQIGVRGLGKVETVFAWRGRLHVLLDGPHGGDPHTVEISEPFAPADDRVG